MGYVYVRTIEKKGMRRVRSTSCAPDQTQWMFESFHDGSPETRVLLYRDSGLYVLDSREEAEGGMFVSDSFEGLLKALSASGHRMSGAVWGLFEKARQEEERLSG